MAQAVAPRQDRMALGVGWMALAVLFFTCIDSSAKWLVTGGLPVMMVVFVRYAGHFAISLATYLPAEGVEALRSRSPWRQFLRSSFLAGSTMLNFAALQHLPITVTTTIMFAGPIVVTLAAIPVLGERVGIRRIAAVCTGFLGVLIVVRPWDAAFHPAMIYSLCALFSAAGYFVMTRMLAGVESNATSQLWSSGIATLALAPLALPVWRWPETATDLGVMVAIGAFGAFGHMATVHANRFADASILAPVIYIQILLAALASILLFDQWPTVWTLAGGAVIIASGLYIWRRERLLKGAGGV
jgi:drug/metabolite transporter (DMT)-like permease